MASCPAVTGLYKEVMSVNHFLGIERAAHVYTLCHSCLIVPASPQWGYISSWVLRECQGCVSCYMYNSSYSLNSVVIRISSWVLREC